MHLSVYGEIHTVRKVARIEFFPKKDNLIWKPPNIRKIQLRIRRKALFNLSLFLSSVDIDCCPHTCHGRAVVVSFVVPAFRYAKRQTWSMQIMLEFVARVRCSDGPRFPTIVVQLHACSVGQVARVWLARFAAWSAR